MMYDFDFIKTGKPSLYRQVPGFTTGMRVREPGE